MIQDLPLDLKMQKEQLLVDNSDSDLISAKNPPCNCKKSLFDFSVLEGGEIGKGIFVVKCSDAKCGFHDEFDLL